MQILLLINTFLHNPTMYGAEVIEGMMEIIPNNSREEALTSLWYTQTESVKFIETLQGFLPV